MSQFTASIKVAMVDAFSPKAKQIKANFGGIRSAIQGFGQTNPVLTQFAGHMSLVAGQTTQMAQGIQAKLAVPAQLAENFEAAGARVTTVLTAQNAIQGDTAGSLDILKAAAINNAAGMSEAGRLSSMSASEYLNSSFTMLSAGLNAKQAMVATEQSVLLAKATGDQASVASTALVGAFNNFGSKTANAHTEMTRISDVMATTQQYFAFEDLQGLSDGLKNVAGAAIAMKAPFGQLNPLLGQLNTNMIKGPEAGTALKNMMSQLGNASRRLGFDIAKTADGGLDMIQTLENIKASGADGAELIKAFGTEAGPAVSILTANLAGVKAGFEAIEKGAGSSLTGAERASDSLQARIEALTLAKEALNQKMGTGANAVRSAGIWIQNLGVGFGNLLSKVPGVGQGMLSIAGGVGQVASVGIGATASFFQFTSGMASTIVMAQQFGGVKSLLKNTFGVIRSGAAVARNLVVGLGRKAVVAGWKMSIAFGAKALSGIKTAGSFIFGLGRKAVVTGWQMAVAFGQKSIGALRMAGSTVAGFGKKAVFAFAKAAVGAWSLAAAHLAAFWPIYAIAAGIAAVVAVGVLLYKNWDTVKAFGATVWNGFTSGIKTAWNWLQGILDNPLIAAAGVIFAPFIAVPALIVKHWSKIKEFFQNLFGTIAAGWQKISGFIGKIFGSSKKSGQALPETMAQGVVAATPKIAQASLYMAQTADMYMPHSNAKKGPLSRLSQSGQAMVDTIQQGASSRKIDLSGPFSPAIKGQGKLLLESPNADKAGALVVNGGLHVSVQAEDLQDIVSFVRMLQAAAEKVA